MKTLGCAMALTAMALPLSAFAQTETEQQAPAVDSAKMALARQIVDLGFPEGQREEMFFGAIDSMVAQMNQAMADETFANDPQLKAKLEEQKAAMIAEMKTVLSRHIPALMDGWATAYAAEFNEKELRDILAFVSTETGKSFFIRNAMLTERPEFQAATRPYMQDVMESADKWQGVFMKTVLSSMEGDAGSQ
ncbi:DUF2059 domain-containing protein [Altericroceibacterium spongiae]|uniref:DUF2059 domain-containing protein n=1 Tax=Altericroceibacterium spongiae TaxID=2320269 RepID=A0A420ECG0_9SPHN|nr:DUF2059 domain-containing protein [Altericroceibacterium spongiae]RKF18370.1 DUF2059 domain-containing protein [Altericroceibacterium spongiae]